MTDAPNRPPSDHTLDRQRRLGEALRANLKRRKSQSRGRADQPASDSASPPAIIAGPTGGDHDDEI